MLTISPTPAQAPPLARRVFHGTLIHSLSLAEIEYLHNALLGVNEQGVIAFVEREVDEASIDKKLRERGWAGVQLVKMKRGEFLMPG